VADPVRFTRHEIVAVLRRVGLPEVADEAARTLPDEFEYERVAKFVEPYGITRDDLISRMGGSP
jgi:hypothetical protein